MGEFLEKRRQDTQKRLALLQGSLAEAEQLCGDFACVYAIGSVGRGEVGQHSDLDLFIAGGGSPKNRALSRLSEIRIKADLIGATAATGFPEFSGDGEYLVHYTIDELTETLGKPEDDVTNTFTARLLWLLESRPLIGVSVYNKLTEDVISAYWKDYEDHKTDFMPAFLANDILRMWRTFCVNYEARTSREPAVKNAKRALKNYKLKHSRLMTCYSGLLYLLAMFVLQKSVHPQDAIEMVVLSPTERLEWMMKQTRFSESRGKMSELLQCYETFLAKTDAPEDELVKLFLDTAKKKEFIAIPNKFGDLMFQVLQGVGSDSAFYRLLLV